MEKAFAKVEELVDTVKEYVNTRVESVKLGVAEKSSAVLANIIARLIVAWVFLLFIVFSSVALALGLGEWLGKTWLGFLIVALMYLCTGIVVWIAMVKIIQLPIMNSLIKQLFNNENEQV